MILFPLTLEEINWYFLSPSTVHEEAITSYATNRRNFTTTAHFLVKFSA